MGMKSRRKGKRFEQVIAAELRGVFPAAEVHRSSQADRAYEPDVVSKGAPVLERLWLELNDAAKPNPIAKLEQAERDITALMPHGTRDLPIVVWHRIRERTVWVTTRMWVLDKLRKPDEIAALACATLVPVTIDFADFLKIIAGTNA